MNKYVKFRDPEPWSEIAVKTGEAMKPDDIPYDVWEIASNAATTPRTGSLFSENYILPIARAIMASRADAWKPIETAPRDGSEFLAYDSVAKKQDVCEMYDQTNGTWEPRAVQSDGEWGPNTGDFGYDYRNITHWMPLPIAP